MCGNLVDAADYCTQALMAASRDGDHATTGRASNNLGVISHLRGRHAEAISSWEIAAADPLNPPALPEGAAPLDAAAWVAVARVLLNLDETITKE